MEVLLDEDMTPEEKIKAANSIASLQSAQVRNEKLKIDARKAAGEVNTAMSALKLKVFEKIGADYPDVANTIMDIANEIAGENELII